MELTLNTIKIVDEIMSIPFKAFGIEFELSAFKLESSDTTYECMCLHQGCLSNTDNAGIPVRIHSGCLTSETFGSIRCDCAWQLKHSLHLINAFKKGLLIYLPWQEGRGNGLFQKIKSFPLMNDGLTTAEAFSKLDLPRDNRDYNPAVAILHRFGMNRIQLITNSPDKINAVKMGGIEIVNRIPSIMDTNDPYIIKYLDSKVRQFGHLISGGYQ